VSDRYRESYRIFEKAKTLIPGGVSGARVPYIPGRYPVYMDRANGARVWDVDGNEYIDWMSGYGCILLGHAYPEVDAAARNQMEKGFISLLSNPLQNELAQRIVETVPCAEMVYFLKTGTDATSAGVRIARIYTGRDRIIRWGYHGWADWAASGFEGLDAGVPQCTKDLVDTFKYNDLDSVAAVFNAHAGEIACLIMMPIETEMPAPGFLEGVKQLCKANGAVLIFDEIRSGFRMAPGGAQEYFGVEPDLCALSKAMANGYAIAAVAGRREIMTALEKGLFSATFFVSSLEMAAALALINICQRDGVVERIWSLGEKFQRELGEVAAQSPLNINVVGTPPMPFLEFAIDDEVLKSKVKDAFYAETTRLGIFFHPGHHWFVNFSHSEEDVEETVEVCEAALSAAEKAAQA